MPQLNISQHEHMGVCRTAQECVHRDTYLVSIQGSFLIPFGLQGLALSPGLTGKAPPPLHLSLTPPAIIN